MPKDGCKSGGAPSSDECMSQANSHKPKYADKCATSNFNKGKKK